MNRVRIFLSSPSDVQPERERAEAVIRRVSAELAEVELEVVRWEEGTYTAAETFQDQITSPGECDLVVCLFWKRLGSPLPSTYNRPDGTPRTGSEYEFETAFEAAHHSEEKLPDIFVYRKMAEVRFSEERLEQERAEKQALDAFWTRWFRDEDGHFLAAFHTFDQTDTFERHFDRHLRRWLQEQRQSDWDIVQQGSPFRGLEAFDEEHAPVFFGRRQAIERARARLMTAAEEGMGSLFVLGASGSGKSSLVRAGLVPRLQVPDGTAPLIDRWRRVVVTPSGLGESPAESLARSLYDADVLPELAQGDFPDPSDLGELLGEQPTHGLRPVLTALDRWAKVVADEEGYGTPPTTGLLVVVDQLEELFRLEAEPRQELLALIRAVAEHSRLWLVTTFRSDFYAAIQDEPALLALKERSAVYDVPPPSPGDIREMIEGAARAAGLRLEEDNERSLAEELEHEAATAGALPMLQFALQSLFETRDRQTGLLRLADYDRLGGAAGALASRAEHILTEMGEKGSRALTTVLRRLVEVGVGSADQAPQARKTRLDNFPAGSPQRELVDRLLEARLLVAYSREDAQAHVRVAHESLFQHWPRATEQIARDRRDLETRARLEQAEALWQAASDKDNKQRLLSGLALEEGRDLGERWDEELPAGLRQYIHASQAAAAARQRRKRATVAGVMTFFIALAAVAGWQWQVAEDERKKAEQIIEFQESMFQDVDPELMGVHHREAVLAEARRARERFGHDAETIEAQMAELEELLAGTNFTNAAVTALNRNVFDPAIEAIEREFADQPLVKAQLLNTIAITLHELGLYHQARPAYEAALDIRRRVQGDEHNNTLTMINNLGVMLWSQGEFAKAEDYLREALETRRRVLGDKHLHTLHSIGEMGSLLRDQGELTKAEGYIREALEFRRRVLGDEHPDTLSSIINLGALLRDQGELAKAEGYIREALEIHRRVLGDEHPYTLGSLINLGLLLQYQGELAEAEGYYREALAAYRRVLGDEHPHTLASIHNMGFLLWEQGEFADAEGYYREALETRRRVLGEEHPDTIISISGMGVLLRDQGRLAEAEDYSREALEASRRVLGDKHPHTLTAINNMGFLLWDQGELSEAERYSREVLETRRHVLGDEHPHTLTSIYNLARMLPKLEQFDEAESLAIECLERNQARYGDDHQETRDALELLIDLYEAWHEHDPDVGHDESAAKWQAKLAALSDADGRDQDTHEIPTSEQ